MALSNQDWLDAQYSVLGSALIDDRVVPMIVSETSPGDYFGACRNIFGAIRKLFLAGGVVDPVSVNHSLGGNYKELIAQLMTITPTAANVETYIRLCKERAKVLTVQGLGRELAEADSIEQMQKLLEQANGMMADRVSVRITSMSDALRSFMDRHSKGAAKYLPWPIQPLNDVIYAEPGDFLIFAGYPSAGKSAWALQCACSWAREYKVGFFSLETRSEKLFDRQMAAVAEISMDNIKRNSLSNEEWTRVCGMTDSIVGQNLELIHAAGMSPADVRAITVMRGYQIVIIDYLQLLQGAGGNRTEQVSGISMALHTMAQSMGVTVVALSQMKRKDVKSGAEPSMSDLRESGQIEQDADVILILSLEKENQPGGNRCLYVAKNKEGIMIRMMLAFDGKHQTFRKASQTGDVVSKYQADGKRAQAKNRAESNNAPGQMTMLPDDTPVPF